MKSTRLGARVLGRPVLACAMALVIALTVVLPGTAMAQSGGQPMSGGAYYVDNSMYYGEYNGDQYGGGYNSNYYTVQIGDTLSGIAMRFGTTTEALMRANGITNPNHIYVGQVLVIPSGGSGGTGGSMCQKEHVVRYGETLSGIAYRYGVDPYVLMQANGISNPNHIYAGEVLCIPTGQGQMPPTHPSQPVPEQPMPPQQPTQPMPPQQPTQPMPPQQPTQPMPPQQPTQPMPPQQPTQPMPPQQPTQPTQPQQPSRPPDPEMPPPMPTEPCQPMPQPQGPQARAIQPDQDPCQPMPPMPPTQPKPPCEPMPSQGPDCGGPPPSHGKEMDHWKGSYFADKYFSEFVEERQDAEVRFNWYKEAPFEGMPKDRFSVRWERAVYFDGGEYRFYATSDDGVRVTVDDQMVIDAWQIQPATENKGDIKLSRGTHWVVVEYYEEAEDAQVNVYWEYKPMYMPHH